MEELILVGYGGHGRSVADALERQGRFHIAGIVDQKKIVEKYTYLGEDADLCRLRNQGIQNAFVSIGYMGKGDVREKLYQKLREIGFCIPVIVDPSAVIAEDAVLGEGTFVGKNAVVNAGAKVGSMCIVNTCAVVEHDCIVDDFSHVAVGAVLCGGCNVGQRVLIGANATVLQERKVGNGTIVGAGCVVRRDVMA